VGGGSSESAGAGGVGSAGAGDGGVGTGGGSAEPVAHAFLFSEYVEGSASYKALELVATAAGTLDGCHLVTYSNGSVTGASVALSGQVAEGGTYTLCSTTLAALLGETCDRTTNLSFNGDDAVALECEGAVLDVIGQIGVDPGTAWTGPSGSTVNATLRRRCDRFTADPEGTDPFDPDDAFTPLPVDTFDGLGAPDCG
jgi:predicted extracellular nuclease